MLREKWLLGFPLKLEDVRPLAGSASRDIAAAMARSLPYTFGVLGIRKLTAFYCRALHCYDQRITLDGAPRIARRAIVARLRSAQWRTRWN